MELLGKSKEQLREFCVALGEPAYRGDQIYHALYAERKFETARMTNLPGAFRERLAKEAAITLPEVRQTFVSSDGSVRYLFGLRERKEEKEKDNAPFEAQGKEAQSTPRSAEDGKSKRAAVEAVYMPSEGRQTICISTQAGCAVDCQFCLTAQLGLIRNLTAGEILGQVLVAEEERSAAEPTENTETRKDAGLKPGATKTEERDPNAGKDVLPQDTGQAGATWQEQAGAGDPRVAPTQKEGTASGAGQSDQAADRNAMQTNVVLMGQGEPLLNFENVMAALRILLDPEGVGLSPKHVTLSTSGIVPGIERLGKETVRPKLAISLNASNDEQRDALMPINRKYPLAKLMEACRDYPLRNWEHLTFEYVMLGGVNDADEDARRVVKLLAPVKRVKVNLIPWNPGELPFRETSAERIEAFRRILSEKGVAAFVRYSRGRDVMAACGQLALKEVNSDERSAISKIQGSGESTLPR